MRALSLRTTRSVEPGAVAAGRLWLLGVSDVWTVASNQVKRATVGLATRVLSVCEILTELRPVRRNSNECLTDRVSTGTTLFVLLLDLRPHNGTARRASYPMLGRPPRSALLPLKLMEVVPLYCGLPQNCLGVPLGESTLNRSADPCHVSIREGMVRPEEEPIGAHQIGSEASGFGFVNRGIKKQ